jgi:hypothetical protein
MPCSAPMRGHITKLAVAQMSSKEPNLNPMARGVTGLEWKDYWGVSQDFSVGGRDRPGERFSQCFRSCEVEEREGASRSNGVVGRRKKTAL